MFKLNKYIRLVNANEDYDEPVVIASSDEDAAKAAVKKAEAEIAKEITELSGQADEVISSNTEIVDDASTDATQTEITETENKDIAVDQLKEESGETPALDNPETDPELGDASAPEAPYSEELPEGDDPVSTTEETLPEPEQETDEVLTEEVGTEIPAGGEGEITNVDDTVEELDGEIEADTETTEEVPLEVSGVDATSEGDGVSEVDEETETDDDDKDDDDDSDDDDETVIEEVNEEVEKGASELDEAEEEAESESDDDSESDDEDEEETKDDTVDGDEETTEEVEQSNLDETVEGQATDGDEGADGAEADAAETVEADPEDDDLEVIQPDDVDELGIVKMDTDDVESKLDEGVIALPGVDVEVSEDDVEKAEEEAEDAEEDAEDAKEEVIDGSKTIEQLLDEKESNEEFIEILQYGIENNQFSPQFAVVVQKKLDKLDNAFGMISPGVPSMENYDGANMKQYYTDLKASLELFNGAIGKTVRNIADGFAKGVNTRLHLTQHRKNLEAVNKEADRLLVKAKDAKEGKRSVRIPPMLANKENILKGASDEIKHCNEIITKCFKADNDYISKLIGHFSKAIEAKTGEEVDDVLEDLLKLKVPAAQYPANTYNKDIGDFYFERPSERMVGDPLKDLNNLREIAIPESGVAKRKGEKSVELSAKDAVEMLKHVKVIVGLANAALKVGSQRGVDHLDTVNRSVSKSSMRKTDENVKAGDLAKVRKIGSSVWDVTAESLNNQSELVDHLISVAKDLNSVAKRIIK